MINWKQLTELSQLEQIKKESQHQPVLIFKHSTRCSISSMALDRLERSWNAEELEGLQPYFLNLIDYRPISNQVAEDFGIAHESPQILIISDGKCIYDNSHMGVAYHEVKRVFEGLTIA